MSTLATLRRKKYADTHDIYGNNEAEQAIAEEMAREADERLRQTLLAEKQARIARGEVWLRPMGIDEAFVPGTRVVYDYGRDPDNRDFSSDVLMGQPSFRGRALL